MGAVIQLWDRLTNVLSGQGTSIDKRAFSRHVFIPTNPAEAEAAYRSSWLVRKIVDIPPFDMTREGRDWQTKSARIEDLEAEEKRLQLWPKAQRALILSRLYGGGALILGTTDRNTDQPLDPERVKKDGLRYVHVMSRNQLSESEPRLDPEDEWFGHPQFFTINSGDGRNVRLHPSRVIAFVGQKVPEGSLVQASSWFWGDPIMQSIGEAVNNAELAQGGFASLIDEAKIDVVKFKDLTSLVATPEGDRVMLARLGAMAAGKSAWRAFALDKEDEWQQRQISWQGMPEVMMAFLQVVAGAADIPITRLLGTSPKGLQSTGDGEERDYQAMVKARQNEMLSPALDRIDPLLIRSALGSVPSDIYYVYAPLGETSEKDAAEIETKFANAFKVRMDTGAIPDDALAKAETNRMVESGRYPGLETAIEESKKDLGKDDQAQQQEADLLTRAQQLAGMQKKGAITKPQVDALLTDAAPRTLYVSRKVENVAELKAWAKAQGLPALQDDLHVTIVYSRTPVDWLKAGNADEWNQNKDGKLTIPAGGPRVVEPLGDRTAVLMFASSELSWRHERIVRDAGASHDYDDYIPHISLTGEPVDLAKVEPYRGKIVLGAEIFEEVETSEVL